MEVSESSLPSIYCAVRCAAAILLLLAVQASAEGAQNKPAGNAEVIPPPTTYTAAPGDPLAQLIGNDLGRDGLRGIHEMTTDIRIKDLRDGKPAGDVPADVAAKVLSSVPQYANGCERRPWTPICYHWAASGLFSNPLYFEDWNLERYGYSPKGLRLLQPIVSAGRFYVTIFTLPYQIVAHPPREKVYSLGYYRPGSPVPYRFSRPQLVPLAGVAAAGFWVGFFFLFP